MHSAYDSLKAGLLETVDNESRGIAPQEYLALWKLLGIAATLAEGSKAGKIDARTKLAALIGRGRCLLNAADLAARPRIEQQAVPPLDLAGSVYREPVQAQGGGV